MRQQPQSEEAEQALLSSIIQWPKKWLDELGDQLEPEHFYQPRHATIYSALQRMYDAQKTAIDLMTLTEFLRDDGQLANVGGPAYVTELSGKVPDSVNAAYYFDTVKRKWLRRKIIATATELVRNNYDETSGEEQVLLDDAQAQITQLCLEATRANALRHVHEGIEQIPADMKTIFHRRGQTAVLGYETGFIDLDRMTGGLQDQQFVVVGARPSQGKTAVVINMAAHMAVNKKIPVLVFTLEMSYTQICRRLAACVAGLNLKRFRDGFFEHERKDMPDIPTEKLQNLATSPIWIDDTGALTIAMFKARARRAVVQYGVKVIYVDYVGLMKSGSKFKQEPWQEVREISQALKATAKELNTPIVVCAQLNREPEGRAFGRPKMGDLRDTGSLEQDSDILLLLWRPVKHLESYKQRELLAKSLKLTWRNDERLYKRDKNDTEPSEEAIQERDRQLAEYAELILAKQRDGPTNPVRLRFIGEMMKFENVTTQAWSNKEEERQQNIEEV
jgi:replicative DNA helicase